MSGQIRKALGPPRRKLSDTLDAVPEIRTNFDSVEDRETYLRELCKSKEALTARYTRFKVLHDRLVDGAFEVDQAERGIIEEVIENDGNLITRFDDLMIEIDFSKNEVERELAAMRQAEREPRLSEEREDPRLRDEPDDRLSGRRSVDSSISGSLPGTHRSVARLPKLQLVQFSGNVRGWPEFWDSFDSAIHSNRELTNVDKMNYLRAQLSGDAKASISGLTSTAGNYAAAIELLQRRYGNPQLIIDSHYADLTNLKPVPNNTVQLRSMYDVLEQHLFSLQSLGESVEHRHFVSIIKQKLPSAVILRLEEMCNGADLTVNSLRKHLGQLISSRERAEASTHSNLSVNPNSNYSRNEREPQRSNPPRFQRPTAGSLLATDRRGGSKSSMPNCAYCSGHHWSDNCSKFPSYEDRRRQLKGNCLGCLKEGHRLAECRSVQPCRFCNKERSHHHSLCMKKFPVFPSRRQGESVHTVTESAPQETATATISATASDNALVAAGENVVLQTALVKVWASNANSFVTARVLFDSGSQRSYICSSLASKMHLKPVSKGKLSVFTFGSTRPREIDTSTVELNIGLIDDQRLKIYANVVPTITGGVSRAPLNLDTFGPLMKTLVLADSIPQQAENSPVDILIGNDYYSELMTAERIEISKGLFLLGSKVGWVFSGRHTAPSLRHAPTASFFVQSTFCIEHESILSVMDSQIADKIDIKNLWDLEVLGIKDPREEIGDEEALKTFNETVRYEDGRYSVKWTWRANDLELPTNYNLALGRLKSLLRQHGKQPEVFAQYQAILDEQLRSGIIERVESTPVQHRVHYIPHHAVLTPSKETTKIRIVYDGSAKTRKENLSLNDCLYRGPVFLEEVPKLLLRFRLHKVAIVADLEKAFLQIGLQHHDRDVTRFVWLKDPKRLSLENNLQIFRFTRVPFGVVSSPFLLSASVTYHLQQANTGTASKILNNIYVDNVITGVDCHEDALLFFAESKGLFQTMSMNIRQFASNDPLFMESIPMSDRLMSPTVKVLGVPWDTQNDTLSIASPAPFAGDIVSKRSVLQFVASIFDPLGLLSPTTLLGKVFMQTLWKARFDWDAALPEDYKKEWFEIVAQTLNLTEITLPRYVGTSDLQEESHFELHCFSDASQKAYGACVYLRIVTPNAVYVHLLMAKSRVAPLETMSIPRLELIAAQVGAKILQFVETSLGIKTEKRFLWTDSQCVLYWLSSKRPVSVFVRNRISKIKSDPQPLFRYVPTQENPADLASRGLPAEDLARSKLWWHGPAFLLETEDKWPQFDCSKIKDEPRAIEEAVEPSLVVPEGPERETSISAPFGIDYRKFSSLNRLLRVTAWAFRFVGRLKDNVHSSSSSLSANELERAKVAWVKYVQHVEFADVFAAIEKNTRNGMKDQLGLWVDNGLIRCGGRLTNSGLSKNEIHPVLLPKGNWFTDLVIESVHRRLLHAGVSHTLASIRNEYWIPSGRARVFQFIRLCKVCKRFDGGPYKAPIMPPLQKSRVIASPPFTHTGLDYFGPLHIKKFDGGVSSTAKIWVCLFTCLATRAIHLETVDTMSPTDLLLAMRRFIARRGTPSTITSDNAKQFKLGASCLKNAWSKIVKDDATLSYTSSRGIEWKFITERAPWMGGFYERLIRLVKQALRKSLGPLSLTGTQLYTVLTEVEAIVNSRPLTHVGSEFSPEPVITPAHFLSLNAKTGAPSIDPVGSRMSTNASLTEMWTKGQKHLNRYWQVWRDSYLKSLRERWNAGLRQPHCRAAVPPRVGDVVHIKGDGTRGTWKLARIVELLVGTDGKIRSAQVRLPSGLITRRAIAHLYPLECEVESDLDDSVDDHDELEF